MSSNENLFSIDTPKIPSVTTLNSEVYDPAEDSFLLLDALEMDLKFSFESNPDILLCLEVGCGSGIISTGVAQTNFFKQKIPFVFALDINPAACLLTRKTAEFNGVPGRIETIQGNGTKKLFRHKFDLIFCNPPYVPTVSVSETENKNLEASWAGGIDGNDFCIPFIQNIPEILNENGVLYLLLSSWNKPEYLMQEVITKFDLQGTLVLKRAAGRERLSVWRVTKRK